MLKQRGNRTHSPKGQNYPIWNSCILQNDDGNCILDSSNACSSGYPLAVVGYQQGQLIVGLVPRVPHSQAPALEVQPCLENHLCPGGQFDAVTPPGGTLNTMGM